MTYYYICDTCGNLANVTEAPIDDDEIWACDECDGHALWEFENKAKALEHSAHIRRVVASGLFRRVGR